MKRLFAIALTVPLLTLSQEVSALCIGCSCVVNYTANTMAFGTYNPLLGSNHDAAGDVNLRCYTTAGLLVSVDIALNKGVYSTVFSPRKMASGANRLNYDLYTNSGRTTIWGDGSGGTGTVTDSITLALLSYVYRSYSVYGRIPGGQNTVPPGSYSDTVTITLTYN
ncbi:MAG: spore coat U domain-containing protein [Gallionellaceae bacterium]|nr:spore coat U domain-containing protein [Gallionellaceae bacterium]